ncbi:Protein of unknown function [Modestobacter sp. DSM 44400]|uniref:ice-binding family protein n=1 Tax=Modestobacter sp. DSM 44400 TaxID=1550230 RepID=UPI00089A292A|nr:ice-binding family protein [Modestobacter sp. DSM 44400]SDY37252.1 Protein of unknown function [Modestobacter sp. DSM 44400]
MTSIRCIDRSSLHPHRQTLAVRSAATAAVAAVAISAAFLATAGSASAATTIPLGDAAAFGVLASTAITNSGTSTVAGDIGASTGALTGTGPSGANSIVLTQGGVDRGNDTSGGQAGLTAAYTAAGSQGNGTVVGPANLALQTQPLLPGIYSSGSDLALTGPLTLDGAGSYDSVFIFRATAGLTTASASSVVLSNGAQACNVFWQVGSSATLGAGSLFSGTILANTSISLDAGVTVDGRLLASTGAVTLISDVITRSACQTGSVPPPVVVPVTTPPAAPSSAAPSSAAPSSAAPSSAAPSSAAPTSAAPSNAAPGTSAAGSAAAGTGAAGRTGTTGRSTTYAQVGRVPVGSVDTGDGSTVGLFPGTGAATPVDLAGQVWSTR